MAYGLYLYKEVETLGGNTARLEIYQKDFTGSALEIDAIQSWRLVMDNQGGDLAEPIIKTSMNISIINTNQINYDVFFTPDATKFKVVYKLNGTTEWTGYLTPDSFIENLTYRDTIALTARDNIGLLEQIQWAGNILTFETLGYFYDAVDYCLSQGGFAMSIIWHSLKVSGVTNIKDVLLNVTGWEEKNCYEVLEMLLKSFALQLRYKGGNEFIIIDINDFRSLPNNAQEVIFINGGGQREIVPAWKDATLDFSYNKLENFYRGYLLADSDYLYGGDVPNQSNLQYYFANYSNRTEWALEFNPLRLIKPLNKGSNPNWLYIEGIYDGYLSLNNQSAGVNDRMTYLTTVEATANALKIEFKASKQVYRVNQSTSQFIRGLSRIIPAPFPFIGGKVGFPNIQLRMRVELAGVTNGYILDGSWRDASTYTGDGMILFNYDGQIDIDDQDISLTMESIPEDGVLSISLYPYEMSLDNSTIVGNYIVDTATKRIYDPLILKEIKMYYVGNSISDGVNQKVTINANANIKGSVELEVSEIPQNIGGFNFISNGVYVGYTAVSPQQQGDPLVGWKWAGGTTYPLFELCARQIIHNNRVQKNKYNGEFITSVSRLTRPLFNSIFNFDNKNLILNYGDYDILDEVMTAELIEVFDYDDITLNFIDTGNEWSK